MEETMHADLMVVFTGVAIVAIGLGLAHAKVRIVIGDGWEINRAAFARVPGALAAILGGLTIAAAFWVGEDVVVEVGDDDTASATGETVAGDDSADDDSSDDDSAD